MALNSGTALLDNVRIGIATLRAEARDLRQLDLQIPEETLLLLESTGEAGLRSNLVAYIRVRQEGRHTLYKELVLEMYMPVEVYSKSYRRQGNSV